MPLETFSRGICERRGQPGQAGPSEGTAPTAVRARMRGDAAVSLVTLASTQSKENAVPESKGRDHKAAAYTPPRTSKAAEPNPTWWAPVFITLLVLGLLWIVVYYVTEYKYPIGSIGVWNLGVGFVLLMGGFIMTMRWR